MKRTVIVLPDDIDAMFRYEARRRGMTLSQLATEAIASHVAHASRAADPDFFSTAGNTRGHVAGRTRDLPEAD